LLGYAPAPLRAMGASASPLHIHEGPLRSARRPAPLTTTPPPPLLYPDMPRTTAPHSVANQMAPLAQKFILDFPREGADAHAVVRRAAFLQDDEFFKPDALPPVLLHASGRPNADFLYGKGELGSEHKDAAYKPGKFEVTRSERLLLGAAMMQCTQGIAVPALLYALPGADRVIVAHIFSAPLAQLEHQLFSVGNTQPTPFETALHGDSTLADCLLKLRAQTGAHISKGGLAALPEYLLTGDYHLVRPGIVPMLRLRSPKTDLELETLERVCMTALQHDHSQPIAYEDGGGPSTIGKENSLEEWRGVLLAVFDRHEDEFEFLNRAKEGDLAGPLKAFRDYEETRWCEATKLARRQVVAPLAAVLLERGLGNHFEDLSYIESACVAGVAFELEEACAMARAREVERVEMPTHDLDVPLSRAIGMCAGTWRLRKMARAGSSYTCLLEMTNQIFGNASDADMAARDVNPFGVSHGDPLGRFGADRTTVLERVAERVAEPGTLLVFDLANGQRVRSMRLCGSAINNGMSIGLDEAARLLRFPWVVPIGTDACPSDQPNGMLILELTSVARDKLTVTDKIRLEFAAKARKVVEREDLAELKRDVHAQLVAQTKEIALTVSNALETFASAVPRTPVDAVPTALPPPPSATLIALQEGMDVLQRGMRKRAVSALSWD
jgi:hypothetical protein